LKSFGCNRASFYLENVFLHCKLVLEIYEVQKQNLKRQFAPLMEHFRDCYNLFLSKKLFQLGIILLEPKLDPNTI
jgi:hypothetical protein